MIEYKDLTEEEKRRVFDKAFTFLHDHSDHVFNSFDKTTDKVSPSGSDLFHPELWKGIHWAWFTRLE